ncbi:MAG: acyltransferase [Muribaculaceae bacterium]|nr:acyltransferase [Muribaculaceae bacterium]
MINSLQSLRGIFAVFIFLHHVEVFAAGGDSGVSFFLVLSGFVMTHGYRHRILSGEITWRSYMRKRLLRIYPLHLIGFLAAIMLTNCWLGRYTPAVWSANLLLLQSWVPQKTVYFSCNAPSWCLSDLMFCYALFPLLIRLTRKLTASKLAALSAAMLAAYFAIIHLLPAHLLTPIIYINPLMRSLDFMLGMALYAAVSSISLPEKRISRRLAALIEPAAVALYALAIVGYSAVPERYGLASYWWLPSSLLILVFALGSRSGGPVTSILNSRPLLWFGNLSFVFYMMHQPVIKGTLRLLTLCGHEVNPAQSPLFICATFTLSLLLSVAVNSKIEPPLRRLLSQKINII